MILLVDINPYISKKYTIPNFSSKTTVITEDYNCEINNNILNVLRIINVFDIESSILTYLGGHNGILYEDIIKNEANDYNIYSIRDKNTEIINISDNKRILSISSKLPRLTNEEISGIYSYYHKEIEKHEYIIIGQSEKNLYSEDFITNFINIAFKSGIKIGLSANKENINYIVKYKPYILVLDKSSLESYSNKELNFIWESNLIIKSILEEGISKVIYFNDKNELQLFSDEKIYSIETKDIFTKGYKDMLLSGYMSAKCRNYSDEMSISIAFACAKILEKNNIIKRDTSIVKKLIKDIKVEKLHVNK